MLRNEKTDKKSNKQLNMSKTVAHKKRNGDSSCWEKFIFKIRCKWEDKMRRRQPLLKTVGEQNEKANELLERRRQYWQIPEVVQEGG